MKKTLAMLLAVMLLLSATAFAEQTGVDTITNGSKPADWDTATGDIDAYDSVHYSDSGNYDTEGRMATELWLQVDATGQIDVTVPLVLVFQTNIDGGSANTASDYKITNHSSAALAVTKIEVAEEAKADAQPMTLVAYPATGMPAEDQYAVKLSVGSSYTFDFKAAAAQADKLAGGLFELAKAPATGAAGTDTVIDVAMVTGPLSFVTARNSADNADAGIDGTRGVKLLTVTYTVAISTRDAVGEEIIGATAAENDLAAAGTPVNADNTGAGTTLGGLTNN